MPLRRSILRIRVLKKTSGHVQQHAVFNSMYFAHKEVKDEKKLKRKLERIPT